MHWHYYIDDFVIIYLCIAYFAYSISKCKFLKYSLHTVITPPAATSVTVIVPLKHIYIYMHHYNHVKLTLLLKSSDLLLPIPFNPCDLSFILAQYLVLNIDG